MPDQNELYEQILMASLGSKAQLKSASLVAAGTHNQGIRIESTAGIFFLKLNFDHERDILTKEADGLQLLRKSTFLKVPEVYGTGRVEDYNFLLSEYIPSGRYQLDYWENMGMGLAHLHLAHHQNFGLDQDNYIASIPQKNLQTDNWTDFYIENRLEPLVGKAYFDKLIPLEFLKKFQEIYPKLHRLFPKEKPSLVHGDLWSGNVISTADGQPCLIDPAVYYGHREMDLAFSRLFGGFDERFYQAYEEILPLESGFEERMGLYNLYPLLVHLNLFGSAYLPGIERTVSKFLK
ncbi:fructosamine kinase family protein [Algoriphagus halophytocola]|uniref:Fructosamine kinase family protein n=1 Tax=Algoriphagus halophytocola TaxID=2991499 RepID=A0ABY6MC23_9BACT|nr:MULTISPECIES: fructosamine kinase family protein [unclassified Algoriphagus]UZD20973.1 fructosamine kinase family protein [Algoriphagus sp. TR-M5]WBL42139.1 fructosamine kinase family protein [Algoriphagus sp. TR-M9]